jgi:hypothetical protein
MSMILHEQNFKFGYFKVGDRIHLSKIQALIDATQRNLHPVWIFNDDIFDRVDWTIEPQESITELYRQRAVQLREKYDYLILAYSGGSDSHTILQTFLRNNIKLDEIVVSWASRLQDKHTPDITIVDPKTNSLSEWTFCIKPSLDYIAKYHPDIKITVHDWTNKIEEYKVKDDFILDRSHNFAPYSSTRWYFTEQDSIKSKLEKTDSVGIILGTDKPRICFNKNAYMLYFLDICASDVGPHNSATLCQDRLPIEFFYWSTDSIKILAKQAHMLTKFFEIAPHFKKYITWPIDRLSNRTFYETATRAIVYPDWDPSTFQTHKLGDMNLGFDYHLFRLGLESKVRGLHTDSFNFLEQNIDKKYFTDYNGSHTLIGFVTKMWPVKILDN